MSAPESSLPGNLPCKNEEEIVGIYRGDGMGWSIGGRRERGAGFLREKQASHHIRIIAAKLPGQALYSVP